MAEKYGPPTAEEWERSKGQKSASETFKEASDQWKVVMFVVIAAALVDAYFMGKRR